jgi:hypothetical protein
VGGLDVFGKHWGVGRRLCSKRLDADADVYARSYVALLCWRRPTINRVVKYDMSASGIVLIADLVYERVLTGEADVLQLDSKCGNSGE